LVASLRNPLLLAQALATLDRIASGRLLLAMSVGSAGRWAASAEVEFDASDAVFHQRAGRLGECIAIMRRLWTADEPFAYEGKYYKFRELSIQPRPMHKRSIPIFLAGIVEPAQRRIARIADGWLTSVRSIDGFMEQRDQIDAYARECGRDPSEISVALRVAFHLDDDGDRARAMGSASVQTSASNRSLSDVSPCFGSPEEVARNIRPLLDRGLVSVTGRLVTDDLMDQERLIGELKQHLAKMLA
jgi:alkanesulfonate monooxygenase SsuD/methylene tetrahydromethanopterin reductase-like flavin-dependent oxidoreductase (luciferase family)